MPAAFLSLCGRAMLTEGRRYRYQERERHFLLLQVQKQERGERFLQDATGHTLSDVYQSQSCRILKKKKTIML